MSLGADYDDIGGGYTTTRGEDPRLAAAIWEALGDARTVLNVGAGTGHYEPRDREVIALEPSEVMIAQRPPHAAPVIRGSAEAIPFEDDHFDAAMAILSDHHWARREQGLREMVRVARRRVVLFNADPGSFARFWFSDEYLPEFYDLMEQRYRKPGVWERELSELLGGSVRFVSVPIPHDCIDGFYGAWWKRPQAFLDPRVRAGISVFSRVTRQQVERAVTRLKADLESGAWQARHRDLLDLEALDLGYRVVVAEFG
jgi:SAM-dependent methyltransferase